MIGFYFVIVFIILVFWFGINTLYYVLKPLIDYLLFKISNIRKTLDDEFNEIMKE